MGSVKPANNTFISPGCPDAELAAVGAAMIERWAALKLLQLVQVDDFYDKNAAMVYEAIKAVVERGGTGIDATMVMEELRRRVHRNGEAHTNELDMVGGGKFLTFCMDKVTLAAHVEQYSRYVREASLERKIYHQVNKTALDPTPEQVKALGDLILAHQGNRGVGIFDMRNDLGPMIEEILEKPEPGMMCGIDAIDELVTGNFHGGEVWTISGRPGDGKTALMLAIAASMTTRIEPLAECLFISTEMRIKENVVRLLSMASGVRHEKIRSATTSKADRGTILEVSSEMSLMPLKFAHLSSPSIDDIRSVIFQAKPKVVFVDQLQDVRLPKAENMAYAIGQFYKELKAFALDTQCLVFIGVQNDRESDRFPNIPPTMSHLKGSGGIESYSDGVAMLWAPPAEVIAKDPDWVPPHPGMEPRELIFRKNRNGPRNVRAALQLNGQLIKICERTGPPEQQEAFN